MASPGEKNEEQTNEKYREKGTSDLIFYFLDLFNFTETPWPSSFSLPPFCPHPEAANPPATVDLLALALRILKCT